MASNYHVDIWQSNKSVLERNKHMLENELETDVVFTVSSPLDASDAQTVRAHRYMLISASPVFWAMLCGQLREDGDVIVPDVTPDAFRELLRYIYTEAVTITGNNVMQILHAAKKYQLSALVTRCVDFLNRELKVSNACSILDHCQFFDEKDLASKCLDKIEANTHEALNSADFMSISNETLGFILDSNKLSMDEAGIFQKCYEWASTKIEQTQTVREVLGDNIYKIRFPIMPCELFIEVVCGKAILTQREQSQILKYLTNPTTSPKPAEFLCEPRKSKRAAAKINVATRKPERVGEKINVMPQKPVRVAEKINVKQKHTDNIEVGDRVQVLREQLCNKPLFGHRTLSAYAAEQGVVKALLFSGYADVKLDCGNSGFILKNNLQKL